MNPNVVLIQCGNRSDGFSVSMGIALSLRLDGTLSHLNLYDCSPEMIAASVRDSDVVAFACPVFSSEIVQSFWDLMPFLHVENKIGVLIVASGRSSFFCRDSIKKAMNALRSSGFAPAVSIIVDNTYGLVKGEFSSKHLRHLDKALKTIRIRWFRPHLFTLRDSFKFVSIIFLSWSILWTPSSLKE